MGDREVRGDEEQGPKIHRIAKNPRRKAQAAPVENPARKDKERAQRVGDPQ